MKLEEISIKHFEWTEQEVNSKGKLILGYIKDGEKALNKAQFYQQEFDLTREEVIKLFKVFPVLLKLSEESVIAKAEFYQQEFGLDKQEFIKMLKSQPVLLSHSQETIKSKAEFYQREFNLSKTEFIKMLKVLPALLGLTEETIKAKVEFYQQEFDLSRTEFIKMLKVLPALLNYSEDSVKEKHKQILDLHIPKSVIIKNPSILTVPTNTLKMRYIILRQVFTREEILSKIWYMFNQDKTYARLRYLQTKGYNIKISQLLKGEKLFVDIWGVESKELMKKYKLTPEVIHKMQEVLEDSEIVDFTEEENQFFNAEYGV